ncbi:hypothetical protein [Streptomyces flaveus]|uniref:CYTH domain-containing protein n=1 Tax=Streptomyces flaveus TaxID=66370 RepID=A0A917RG26_9ACTN|nr:hypothetical protein [Streptomyces flaveus]GGL05495.1 hypothetical protein GCM10010094_77840 [Streptomyces flaveus]
MSGEGDPHRSLERAQRHRPSGHRGAGPSARLDAVQVKISLGGRAVGQAVRSIGLCSDGERCRVHFCELPEGALVPGELPLLESGVILRLRTREDRRGDSTVKLRPCRRSRLTERWLAFRVGGRDELRLEADWVGEERVLAASLVTELDRGVDLPPDGGGLMQELFSPAQQEFLVDCADIPVDFRALQVLGPVQATRWRDARCRLRGLTAERWTVRGTDADGGSLEFLELSLRAAPDEAEIAQAGLEALVRRLGLESDTEQTAKTRLVLEHLRGAR